MTDVPEPTEPTDDPLAEPDLSEGAEQLTDDELLAAASASPLDPAEEFETGVPPRSDYDSTVSDSAGGFAPPPPPAPGPGHATGVPPGPRRLYRSSTDRKVGGVSAGIAEYFAIDPTLVRLGMLAFIVSGVGILVYLAAWLIVPTRPDHVPYHQPPRSPAGDRTMTLAFGLAALALAFGIVTDSWEVLALALIGGGIWLLSEQTRVSQVAVAGANPAAGTVPPASYAPNAYVQTPYPGGYEPQTVAAAAPQAATYANVAPAPPATKVKQPQRITWIVLSLLALIAAIGMAAASGDWWDVSATRLLGIAIVTIGVGVVAGQIRNGGARGLIPLGILCALALFPVSAVDGLIDDGIGESTVRPATIAALEDSYSHGIGKFTVDLSEINFDGRNDTLDIDLGIGELIVIVPEDVGGQAVLQAKAGELVHRLPNTTNTYAFEEGLNIETGTVSLEGELGSLDLNISVGLGTAELRSVAN